MVRKLHLDEDSSKYKKYIGAEAVLVGDYEDFVDYLTDRELAEIEEYIDSDCDIISLGGPNKSYAVIRFSDGAKFTLPFEFLEIDEDTLDECRLTEEQTGKDAVWLDFRLEPEMKGQLICADCEQTLNGRNCKGKLVHAVSYKWDRYDGMEWRCFCTRCYNSLKDENPDELIDSYGPSTNY